MPNQYAHYRFGTAQLKIMPQDAQRICRIHRSLYDLGLHGPDIFFYYNPATKNKLAALGHKYHFQSGFTFFFRVCRMLRLNPSEEGLAYLFGVLGHYCLDAVCHPYVNKIAEDGSITHTEMETEFERLLLELDGKLLPKPADTAAHIAIDKQHRALVASFYPNATAGAVGISVQNMRFFTRLLTGPDDKKQQLLKKLLGRHSSFVLTPTANERCRETNEALLSLYEEAMTAYPAMLDALQAHLRAGTPLGALFDPIFG